ncbi:MAG: cardiolipin synthase [Gemmataceae bacterium]
MELWRTFYIELTAVLGALVMVATIVWVLMTKKDSTSAVAWCLLVFFVPFLGALLFVVFGYQHVHRPLRRKKLHSQHFRRSNPRLGADSGVLAHGHHAGDDVRRLAELCGAYPVSTRNRVIFYHEGEPAFADKLAAIEAARHHIHLEYFIFQNDATGQLFLERLARKAREGVEVRLLYDAIGSRRLSWRVLKPLLEAGGKCRAFLPLNPFRRRIQVNLRDHRKLLIVDGQVVFTGGLNIGDEYLGKVPFFGFWRDTHLRLEGRAVHALQRVFTEDWDFAADENLRGPAYFPDTLADWSDGALPSKDIPGRSATFDSPIQVIQSGPDQELKTIREIFFTAIIRARRRLWIASPYFVPDAGLLDALCLAARSGVDVRLLSQRHPDRWIPFYAARYYWGLVLDAGVKVYQFKKGMMHSKVVMVDGEWATVGTANFDNRSLHLNFEVNCLFYSPEVTAELEQAFLRDLGHSIRVDPDAFARRPVGPQMLENACRLLSPVL